MYWFTSLQKKRGLEIPGALCPQVVKELRRHYSLMINFPPTLPLPDLSKQGRAEEREAEGGEKAGEESLGCSNCTSTLQLIPKQLRKGSTPPGGTRKGASQERDRRSHAVVRGAKDPSLCLLTPMFCKPRVHPSSCPSRSLQAHSHNRGKVFPICIHPLRCFQPHKLFSNPIPSATTVP